MQWTGKDVHSQTFTTVLPSLIQDSKQEHLIWLKRSLRCHRLEHKNTVVQSTNHVNVLKVVVCAAEGGKGHGSLVCFILLVQILAYSHTCSKMSSMITSGVATSWSISAWQTGCLSWHTMVSNSNKIGTSFCLCLQHGLVTLFPHHPSTLSISLFSQCLALYYVIDRLADAKIII